MAPAQQQGVSQCVCVCVCVCRHVSWPCRHCELCKHRFQFTPVYRRDMPPRLPLTELVGGAVLSLLRHVRRWLHLALVALMWLAVVPISVCMLLLTPPTATHRPLCRPHLPLPALRLTLGDCYLPPAAVFPVSCSSHMTGHVTGHVTLLLP